MVLNAPSTVKIFSLCSPECQAAGNVPHRTAALSHDNNPTNQFVSDSPKYMRISPNGLDFDRFESLAASAPGLFRRPRMLGQAINASFRHHLGISGAWRNQ
jgi:hypothetical protein